MDVPQNESYNQPSAPPHFSFRRVFLVSLIASLSLGALIAIYAFLFGDFGETEIRILLTTASIGGFSLTGLASSSLYERKRYLLLAYIGIVVSVFGFLLTTSVIWEITDFDEIWRFVAIAIILSASIAHSSLLLLGRSQKRHVDIVITITVTFVALVALLLTYMVIVEFDLGTFAFRTLGTFAVLDVLGTIVTPLLRRLNAPKI